MSKITCFWCDNEVEKDGQLCPSCQKRYDQTQKEYEQIDKEYNELFGNLDCIGMIKLFKTKDQQIKDLENQLQKYERMNNWTVSGDLLNQYAKLEAQLKEKDAEIDDLKRDYIPKLEFGLQRANKMGREADKENIELKQQLAEKEKEIERLLIAKELLFSDLHYARMDCEKTNRQIRELDKSCGGIINNLTTQIEQTNQDKISFAVEQLEKVLVLIHNAVNIDSPEYDLVGLYDAVSNQIKQLKEMKSE